MINKKIISPCISICKNNPDTGYCYGCARSNEEKKIWKHPETKDQWKIDNLIEIKKRMKDSQLKIFEKSYSEKLSFGKLVFSKQSEKKPQN